MELFQLRYFLSAARLGSFSRAASECHISQPSLSVQIANLERELGTPLFARVGRTVRLTDAGQTLVEYSERILYTEQEARRAVRQVVGLERGRLSVWTLPTPGQNLLPPLLAQFRNAYPQIAITVHEMVPARAIGEAVASGKADIGMVQLPCSLPGLSLKELLTEELVVIVPNGHRLVGTMPPLSALRDEDFVWVPEGASPEHPIYAACIAAGFTPRISCVSGSASGMQTLVAAGLGIALLPRLAVHLPAGVAVVELAAPRPTRTLAVVWRTDDLSHSAQAFLNELAVGLPPAEP